MPRAERHDRDHADVELGAAEAHLERQAVDPVVVAGLRQRGAARRAPAKSARTDFRSMIVPIEAEEDDVGRSR